MQEIELKFQIPAHALERLRAELRTLPDGELPPQRLQAAYFDTADRKLARARAALRVRQEDDDWVQTLKAAGPNAMTRLEDNQPLPGFAPDETIWPDLARHTDEHVRQALMRDLGWQPAADPHGRNLGLLQLYRTDMQRLRAQVDTFGATPPSPHPGQAEMALDLGKISAGTLTRPVCELEIELVDGDPRAVLDVARDFVRRHGLWLDTQTKAHRGDQLAREAECGQPSPLPPARPRTRLKPGMSAKQQWLTAVDAALEQIGACMSEVALYETHRPVGRQDAGVLNPTPWIQGWANGLRRLLWLWRQAPDTVRAEATCRALHAQVMQAAHLQLRALRPLPSHLLDGEAAALLARSAAPTLLALDVLELCLAMSA